MSHSIIESWIDKMSQHLTALDSNGNTIDPVIYVWDANTQEQLEAWVSEEASFLISESTKDLCCAIKGLLVAIGCDQSTPGVFELKPELRAAVENARAALALAIATGKEGV